MERGPIPRGRSDLKDLAGEQYTWLTISRYAQHFMPPNFAGIFEKLKRTNEHIHNLQAEINAFFQAGKYPIIPEDDKDALLEAIAYHKQRVIPLRFSVLAGEIIHHLRSCLDHVAWQFSSETYRRDHERKIEFPVFEVRPSDKDSTKRYKGKIKGITDARILSLIEALQPYNAPDPSDCPLLILHKMDVIYKHRELALCIGTGARVIPAALAAGLDTDAIARLSSDQRALLALDLKPYGKLVADISFKEFGRRTIQPVVPALIQLNNYFVQLMKQFDP